MVSGSNVSYYASGVRRKDIFDEEMDYQIFSGNPKIRIKKYECILHAYCLMTNYIHLLLETTDIEIGKSMKFLSERYAMYMNHKYLYRGHVDSRAVINHVWEQKMIIVCRQADMTCI